MISIINYHPKLTIKLYGLMWNIVMGYETSKLITSDTDLERGNAQRERWKIVTTCWSPRVYVIQRTNGCGSAQTKRSRPRPKRRLFIE